MKNTIFLITGLLLIWHGQVKAQDVAWTSARPDGHAPIGIMQDHYHKKNQVMFSYRYMSMWMKGDISGTAKIGNDAIYQNYMVAPQKMTMQMHMVGAMYAPVDWVTLMIMGNYTMKTMDLRTKSGIGFPTQAEGFGDVTVTGLLKIFNRNKQSLHGIVGLSLPTGSIDQRSNTPMMQDAKLAYPMQLGSGTYDPLLGLTYLGQSSVVSWGLQGKFKFRTAKNNGHYQLGNEMNAAGWAAFRASDWVSFSGSLKYQGNGRISGADPDLNPMMMPLFNTANSGSNRMDIGIGSNFLVPKGVFKELRFGAEYNIPVYQHVNGIQMYNQGNLVVGVQYAIE